MHLHGTTGVGIRVHLQGGATGVGIYGHLGGREGSPSSCLVCHNKDIMVYRIVVRGGDLAVGLRVCRGGKWQ